jgi:signal peptidase
MKNVIGIIKWVVVLAIVVFGVILGASALPIPGNYSVYTVLSGSMEPAIHTGSIVIVKPQTDYAVGDVVTVASKGEYPVTHRIVDMREEDGVITFTTKGDANEDADGDERAKNDVIGRAVVSVPWIGYPIAWAQKPMGFMLMIVVPGTLIVYHEILNIITEIKKKLAARKTKKLQSDEDHNEERNEK